MEQEQFYVLLELYLANGAGPEGLAALHAALETPEAEGWLQQFMDERMADGSYVPQRSAPPAIKETGYLQLLQRLEKEPELTVAHRRHIAWQWGWAAAVVIFGGISLYYWSAYHHKTTAPVAVNTPPGKVQPGQNGAVLTLANGSTVVLDSLGNGLVSTQNGAKVMLQNGKLRYDAASAAPDEVAYNTITTPKGRAFQVTLPDGTKVWLNAASSIRYPTAFTGNERLVAITGEVYFEVATNAQMPFQVNIHNKAKIEVLGTRFNVNAYDNESSLNATLLQGAIRVLAGTDNAVIKPGQQAQVKDAALKVTSNVNLETVMAWKNGLFNFEGKGLAEVMRQLERWYDLEVIYEKGVPDIVFGGEMSRDISLEGVLRSLEASGVHFRLENRKLIVMP